jgi:hypothetical protein
MGDDYTVYFWYIDFDKDRYVFHKMLPDGGTILTAAWNVETDRYNMNTHFSNLQNNLNYGFLILSRRAVNPLEPHDADSNGIQTFDIEYFNYKFLNLTVPKQRYQIFIKMLNENGRIINNNTEPRRTLQIGFPKPGAPSPPEEPDITTNLQEIRDSLDQVIKGLHGH